MSRKSLGFIPRLRCLTQAIALFTSFAACSAKAGLSIMTTAYGHDIKYTLTGPYAPNTTKPTYKALVTADGVLVSYQTLNPSNSAYSELFHTSAGQTYPDGVLFAFNTDYTTIASKNTPPPHITCSQAATLP